MSVPELVNGLTTEQLRERLGKIKCFMLDMDGTFYLGNQILEGSLDFLDAVERTGRRVLFLTNNSSKSADHYIQKLRKMNVREPFLNILTSGQATTALQGAEVIRRLVGATPVKILAGSGITPWNVADLLAATGVHEVHGSCKATLPDGTLQTDTEQVKQLIFNSQI